ncbi:MAG: universal stress protein [Acidimicrobiia bacterium]|nr:universal stress protein [Acidimicrobiia bacterium]
MNIVVGYVATDQGRAAVERAIEEARRRGARLVVVHSLGKGSGEEAPEYQDRLEALRVRLEEVDVDGEIHEYARGQSPAEDILQAAREFEAGLVVIGLRDRTRTGKFFLGSNAQDVLLGAPCDVLAVKPSS